MKRGAVKMREVLNSENEYRHKTSGCDGKIRYPSKRQARGVKKRILAQEYGEHVANRLQVYKCKYCNFWHLGHSRKNRHLKPELLDRYRNIKLRSEKLRRETREGVE